MTRAAAEALFYCGAIVATLGAGVLVIVGVMVALREQRLWSWQTAAGVALGLLCFAIFAVLSQVSFDLRLAAGG